MKVKMLCYLVPLLIGVGVLTTAPSDAEARRFCWNHCTYKQRCYNSKRCYYRPYCSYKRMRCYRRRICTGGNTFLDDGENCRYRRVCRRRRVCTRRRYCRNIRRCYPRRVCSRICEKVPSRDDTHQQPSQGASRNWLDGTLDPYYGGSAGALKGHKFSLYEGGIRVPGIIHWPGTIPAGQVLDGACASMDVFPTLLRAAGGDPSQYELDGSDILPHVANGAPLPQRDLYWEMGDQTAVRRGPWKLVLNGRLVENAPPEDAVHLANLDEDLGERTNRAHTEPERTAELKQATETWRNQIEERWERDFSPDRQGIVTH